MYEQVSFVCLQWIRWIMDSCPPYAWSLDPSNRVTYHTGSSCPHTAAPHNEITMLYINRENRNPNLSSINRGRPV